MKSKVRVIPLGGLSEIGKNMMAIESGEDIIVIDAGLMFPEEEMLGIDLVIPDITYLLERSDKIRGIIVTHGHEDHAGGLAYILRQINTPVYATRLTQGLITVKLKEHKLLDKARLITVQAGEDITLGVFRIELFRVNHSIPDSVGLAIHTPAGVIVHTGDFKFDHTPVDNKLADFAKLAQLGSEGVLLLLSDSTYVENLGYTPSERVVGETLDRIMGEAPGRVIVATFASLISRVQQLIDAAAKHDRKVFVVGRSMVNNVQMAMELGYLSAPPGVLRRVDEMSKFPHHQIAIVTTGSQGEPTSVLTRMANRDHRQIRILPDDTVIVSATSIPGNEGAVNRTIDNLFRQGATVLYSKIAGVHVHGHGSQEELKMMLNLVKPKFFAPIHGEYRHLVLHAKLARSLGLPQDNTFVLENGSVLELTSDSAKVSGKVQAGCVYVDGLGVGDIGTVVLRDRQALAQEGIVVVIVAVNKQTGKIVSKPDIVSRGFVFIKESEELIEQAREVVAQALNHRDDHIVEWGFVNSKIKDSLSKYLYDQTKRRPMILPVAVEV